MYMHINVDYGRFDKCNERKATESGELVTVVGERRFNHSGHRSFTRGCEDLPRSKNK